MLEKMEKAVEALNAAVAECPPDAKEAVDIPNDVATRVAGALGFLMALVWALDAEEEMKPFFAKWRVTSLLNSVKGLA